ncbi:hypothetical protein KAR91_18020 [Candidatus Pacearchaeota archaeon]|nr:hypothetical protein [Candidatus Pacearchaeota archaeon]
MKQRVVILKDSQLKTQDQIEERMKSLKIRINNAEDTPCRSIRIDAIQSRHRKIVDLNARYDLLYRRTAKFKIGG